MVTDQSARLNDLARRVERLTPNHRDPERFHQDKDEIVRDLRRMAKGSVHRLLSGG